MYSHPSPALAVAAGAAQCFLSLCLGVVQTVHGPCLGEGHYWTSGEQGSWLFEAEEMTRMFEVRVGEERIEEK